MSLFESASLVVTPNGTKASKLYAIKPTDGSGDLTVTRATTATRVNSAGLIESVAVNVPRLDYTNSTCPSILVEPQRTNLALYSSQFDNAAWSKGTITTISANTVISPDGTQNADTVTCNGAGVTFTRQITYLGTTSKCSNSIYAKKGNTRYFAFRNFGDSGGKHDVFDFDTKTWTQNTSAVLSYEELDNGWFRLKSVNSDVLGNYFFSFFPTENTSGDEVDTINNKNVYVWGAQAEIGSYATSYIPTTSASVTRNADVISKTGISSLIGQTEGTIFVEEVYDATIANNGGLDDTLVSLTDGTSSNLISIFHYGLGIGNVLFFIRLSGTTQVAISSSTPTSGTYKIALAYKNNDVVGYINGVQIATDTSATIPATSAITLVDPITTNAATKTVKRKNVAVWKTRLSNGELSTLTTI